MRGDVRGDAVVLLPGAGTAIGDGEMGKRARRRARQHKTESNQRQVSVEEVLDRRCGRASLQELHRLVEGRQRIDRRIEDVVDQLVDGGVGWVLIGEALGITRQAARQAFLRRRAARA